MNETLSPRNGRSTILVVALIAAVIAIPFLLQPRHTANGPAALGSPASTSATLGDKSTTGKIVMLDFYTDWCGYCKKMDAEVYPEPTVKKAMEPFEFRRINAEQGAENVALAEKYHIDGFPTIVFVNAKGAEVHRIIGYQPADEFVKSLAQAAGKGC